MDTARPHTGKVIATVAVAACATLDGISAMADDEIRGAPRLQARAELLWTKALCTEPGRYIGWPTVCRAKDGDIIVVFSGDRDEHICPFGKSQLIRSADGGQTWSEARPVGLDGFPPHLIRLADGKLLSSYGRRWGDIGEFACLSDDQGRTWDVKNEIKLAGHWNGDRDLPPGSVVISNRRMGNGFSIRNCTMGHNRARGLLIKASNGVIEGNLLERVECYAVQITQEYEWMEGGCSRDVVVRGNTLVDNGGGVWLAGNNGARKPLPADSHRNVAITGNTISGSLNGIRVVGCTGLDLRGNTVTPSSHPDAVGIVLSNVADVKR